MKCRLYMLSALLLMTLVTRVDAWGGEGHQVVALIAEERITPTTEKAIHELLGKDVNISDAEIASWADQIKRERRNTAPWHYVNIPYDSKGYDIERDGKHGNNLIERIDAFKVILADKSKSKEDRAEALKFLVHLVGDLHQPLHCIERNNDKGGNARLCFLLEEKGKATNLHTVWDTTLLRKYVAKTRIADYSDKLNKQIDDAAAKNWRAGDTVTWANESWKVGVDHVYKGVPVDGAPPILGQKYVDDARLIVETQLERGGVRLAKILNEALDK